MVKRKVMLLVLCGGISGLLYGAQPQQPQAGRLSQLDEDTKSLLTLLVEPGSRWSKAANAFNALSDAEKKQLHAEAEKERQEFKKEMEEQRARFGKEMAEEEQAAEQTYKANKATYEAVLAGLTEVIKKQETKQLLNKYAGEVAKLAGSSLKGDALRTRVREILKNRNDMFEITYKIVQEKDDTKKMTLRQQRYELMQKSIDWYGLMRALEEKGENAEIVMLYHGLLKDFVQELAKQFAMLPEPVQKAAVK